MVSKTESPSQLLQVCVQDLHAGCRAVQARLPGIASHAEDAQLRATLGELSETASQRAARLAATGCSIEGPENLWMAGILDDAERDTRSIAPGELLDLALVGAVRKALAAEDVSIETAIALADRLSGAATLDAVRNNATEVQRLDGALRDLLNVITARIA
jgi:ferritin-like metal-binding protein YciE